METRRFGGVFLKRYVYVVFFLGFMICIHLAVIPLHPLIFLVWSLSLWMLFEVYSRFRESRFRLSLFVGTFCAYVLVTNSLVVVDPSGIYFNLEPAYNLPALSNVVLAEVLVLFVYDALIARSVTPKDVPAYVGFASIIPWISPAIVEAYILAGWYVRGAFSILTWGKGLGGAGLQDILFRYGGKNFVVSSLACGALVATQRSVRRLSQTMEERRIKRRMAQEDRVWLTRVWEDPISLLSEREREEFMSSHRHLDREERNRILRDEVLPAKGVRLIDPRAPS